MDKVLRGIPFNTYTYKENDLLHRMRILPHDLSSNVLSFDFIDVYV
jgi:hypothetical protein